MRVLLLLLSALVTIIYYLVERFLIVKHDAKEPPLLPHKIPFLGHAIELMRKKMKYYVQLRYVNSIYYLYQVHSVDRIL